MRFFLVEDESLCHSLPQWTMEIETEYIWGWSRWTLAKQGGWGILPGVGRWSRCYHHIDDDLIESLSELKGRMAHSCSSFGCSMKARRKITRMVWSACQTKSQWNKSRVSEGRGSWGGDVTRQGNTIPFEIELLCWNGQTLEGWPTDHQRHPDSSIRLFYFY